MEELNYLEIILDGISKEPSRKNLADYFYRNYKKAQERHYSSYEFFTGLTSEITILIDEYRSAKKRILEDVEDRTKVAVSNPFLSDEEKLKRIDQAKDKINLISETDYKALDLADISGNKYSGSLTLGSINAIFSFIEMAFEKVKEEEIRKTKDARPKNDKLFEEYFISLPKDIKGLKEYMAKRKGKELAGIICVLQENGYLPEKINRSGFLKSIGGSINISGVNDFLKEDEDLISVISYDRDYLESIQKQIVKFV